MQNQTWTSSFEPILLNAIGPLNYQKTSAGKDTEVLSKNNFSHAASKFLDRRKKTGASQVSTTERSY